MVFLGIGKVALLAQAAIPSPYRFLMRLGERFPIGSRDALALGLDAFRGRHPAVSGNVATSSARTLLLNYRGFESYFSTSTTSTAVSSPRRQRLTLSREDFMKVLLTFAF